MLPGPSSCSPVDPLGFSKHLCCASSPLFITGKRTCTLHSTAVREHASPPHATAAPHSDDSTLHTHTPTRAATP
jgi:hypothetical protein